MTQKPEALLWSRVKKNLPSKWHITRIENRLGGGVPDVHICANHLPFWIELKVTKTNRVSISAQQIAWNYGYFKSGGVSFYLVNPLSTSHLYLFSGEYGRELATKGLGFVNIGSGQMNSGSGIPCLWSGDDFSGLIETIIKHTSDRVGIFEPIFGVGGRDNNLIQSPDILD